MRKKNICAYTLQAADIKVLASPATQVISNGKPGTVYVNKLIAGATIASEW